MRDLRLTLKPVLKLSFMKSQLYLLVLTCILITSSCRNSESQRESETINNDEEEFSPVDRNIPRQDVEIEGGEEELKEVENDSSGTENRNHQESSQSKSSYTSLSGNYIKEGQETDNSCDCYCIDLNFSSNVELCLISNDMYIRARLERNSDNSINVFLVDPSAENSQGEDIPWQDFDRNSPIAKITPQNNGNLDVDWLGFTINGDLAMDYAILGKKTLEGSYKKK